MLKWVVVFAFLLSSITGHAQIDSVLVEGVVLLENRPLPGAAIRWNTSWAITNDIGKFSILVGTSSLPIVLLVDYVGATSSTTELMNPNTFVVVHLSKTRRRR